MNLLLTRAKRCMRRTREARREGSSEFADRVMICTRLKETLSGPLRRILDNASASRGNQTRGVYESAELLIAGLLHSRQPPKRGVYEADRARGRTRCRPHNYAAR